MNFWTPYLLSFTILAAVFPYLAVLVRGLGYSPTVVGLLIGIFEVAGIGGPFLLGRSSDKLGRYKPGIIITLFFILASLWPLSYLRHPLISALSLVLLAIGVRSLIPLLDAVVTLRLDDASSYGKVRAMGSGIFVVMALFLQFSPIYKPENSINIAFWIAITTFVSLLFMTLMPDIRPSSSEKRRTPLVSIVHRRTRADKIPWNYSPIFIAGLIMIGLGRLAMSPINSFFSLYVVEELGWDAVGLMWAISSGSEIPIIFVSGLLIRRFGAPRLLAVSIIAVGLRLGIYALFPTPAGAISGQLLHSLCFGLFHPAAVAFVTTHVPAHKRAMGLSMYLSLGVGLPTFLGSSLGGFIVDLAGYRFLFGSYISFALCGLGLYAVLRKALEEPVQS